MTCKILNRFAIGIVLTILVITVSACGAKGDLFLPEDVVKEQQKKKEEEKKKQKKQTEEQQPATEQPVESSPAESSTQ